MGTLRAQTLIDSGDLLPQLSVQAAHKCQVPPPASYHTDTLCLAMSPFQSPTIPTHTGCILQPPQWNMEVDNCPPNGLRHCGPWAGHLLPRPTSRCSRAHANPDPSHTHNHLLLRTESKSIPGEREGREREASGG